jgi:hypothetical protein
MHTTIRSSLAIFLLLISPALAQAQTDKPVAVVSVASADDIIKSAGTVGELIGMPLDQMLGGYLDAVAGLDRTKPIVFSMTLVDGAPTAVACVPVTDFKALLGALPPPFNQTEDAGKGVLLMTNAPQPVFIKDGGAWAYVSNNADTLDAPPADPAALAGDLPTKYLLAIRASAKSIPKEQLEGYLGFFQMLAMTGLQQQAADPQDFEMQRNLMQKGMERLQRFLNDLDDITVGIAVDDANKSLVVETGVTAVEGSRTAAQYAQYKDSPTNHAGFLSAGATLSVLVTLNQDLADEDVALIELQKKNAITRATQAINNDAGIPAEAKASIIEALTTLIDAGFESLKGTMDAGVVAWVDDKSTLVAGGRVADGAAVEGAVKTLAKMVEQELPVPINWDAETYKGFNIHTAAIPIPEPEAHAFFGEEMEIALAFAADACYLSVGGDGIERVKYVIDASAEEKGKMVKPVQARLSLAPIAAAVANVAPPAAEIAPMLQENGNITMSTSAISNGVLSRLEVQGNVFKAIGALVPMLMDSAGGAAAGEFGAGGGDDPFGN